MRNETRDKTSEEKQLLHAVSGTGDAPSIEPSVCLLYSTDGLMAVARGILELEGHVRCWLDGCAG